MLNESFYNELSLLKEFSDFKNILSLQEGKFEIEYHTELLLRYFILKTGNIDYTKYKSSQISMSTTQLYIALINKSIFLLL